MLKAEIVITEQFRDTEETFGGEEEMQTNEGSDSEDEFVNLMKKTIFY